MADLVPAGPVTTPATAPATTANAASPGLGALFSPLTDPAGGSFQARMAEFAAQPAVRKALPLFIGLSAIGGAALAWSMISPSPQRTLYSQLDDSERAGVAAALDQAAIGYRIDNATGALTVSQEDYYKARMLVASDGALATPGSESGAEMLDRLPMGASRTLEGSRLRAARERDLQQTIMEIDGVEAVRVHLAEAEKSVFVRENLPPSASVMVRLARGRQLSDSQVAAIVNLVAASVPGLAPDKVRVVDQHGRLFTETSGAGAERLELQARMEEKLRAQVAQLLRPMLGEGRFTSEIQIELDMDEVTSARERYDKDGAVRTESQAQSQSTGTAPAVGIPGVLSNTPPLPTEVTQGAPQGTPPVTQPAPTNGESSSNRTYELGREVSVSETRPGGVRRVSVAVAIAKSALSGAREQDLRDIESLVAAAVGADARRGDQVKVIARDFETVPDEVPAIYETPWFATLVRYGAAVLAVLFILVFAVRPMLKAVRGESANRPAKAPDALPPPGDAPANGREPHALSARDELNAIAELPRAELLQRQVGLAQRLVAEQPDSAVKALRQMLHAPHNEQEQAA